MRKKLHRLLTAIVMLLFAAMLLPVGVSAAQDDTVYNSSQLYLDKHAVLEDDGTYTITLETLATGSPVTTKIITGHPLDVVLVIDQSGSIVNEGYYEDLQEAVLTFIDGLSSNGNTIGKTHRVAIVGFSSNRIENSITFTPDTTGDDANAGKVHKYPEGSRIDHWTNTGIFLNDGTFKNYETYNLKPINMSDLKRNQNGIDTNGLVTYTGAGNDLQNKLPKYYAEINGDLYPIYYLNYTWRPYFRGNNTNRTPSTIPSGAQYYERVDVDANGDFIPLTQADYANTFMNVTDGIAGEGAITAALGKIVQDFGASGATRPSKGMEMAYDIFRYNPFTEKDIEEGRERVVVMFTDGQPGFNTFEEAEANLALEWSAKIKDPVDGFGAEVYTVGLHKDNIEDTDNVAIFLQGISSNYPEADSMEDVYGPVETMVLSNLNLNNYDNTSSFTANVGITDLPGYYVKVDDNYYQLQYKYVKTRINTVLFYYDYKHEFTFYYKGDDGQSYEYEPYKTATKTVDNFDDGIGMTVSNKFYTIGTANGYLPAASDKYYKETSDSASLKDMFPVIINESTSTTLESQYLTQGSILRDIMGTGFVLTDNSTITATTLTGTWVNTDANGVEQTGNAMDGKHGKIIWADKEEAFASYSIAANGGLEGLPKPDATSDKDGDGSIDQKIQIYNTNAANLYRADNPNAPHTVDITGFNYDQEYFGYNKNVGDQEHGKKLIVRISHVEALAETMKANGKTLGPVSFNQQTMTNHEQSGFWTSIKEDGSRELIATFPLPPTYFKDAVYVMDYAKPLTLDADELMITNVDSVDTDGMNYFAEATTNLSKNNGCAAVSEGKLIYQPSTMNWDAIDSFFVFGDINPDSAISKYEANGAKDNLWSRVSVIPANNVYYEDTFIQSEENGVSVGITYSGDWSVVGTADGNVENAEHQETVERFDEISIGGGVHGWEDTLADDTLYSDGNSHYSASAGATATFSFSGTGVDIYSRTNMMTGSIIASLYSGDKAEGMPIKNLMMDNHAASGDYYQIPTLSFNDLEYGIYTVKLIVCPVKDTSGSEDGKELVTRYDYYLDGIRIYNPIKDQESNTIVQDAYGADELNATFKNVRDILIDAKSFEAGNNTGVVFVDRIVRNDTNKDGILDFNDGVDAVLADYEVFGPKNEVYLKMNQAVAFVPVGNDSLHYYIGLKSPTGQPVYVETYMGGEAVVLEISHTTDMYYEVTPSPEGVIMINHIDPSDVGLYIENQESLLSVTKLKVAGTDAVLADGSILGDADVPTVMSMVRRTFATRNEVPEITEPDTEYPDINEPDVEIKNPNDNEPEIDVDQNSKPKFEYVEQIIKQLKKLKEGWNAMINSIYRWFM